MENTYWVHKGTYSELNDKLEQLVPSKGSVEKPWKNKALERFRKASNAYYDIFNNGGGNRMRAIAKIFGTDVTCHLRYRVSYREPDWDAIFSVTEPKMDAIILEAAKEQGIA